MIETLIPPARATDPGRDAVCPRETLSRQAEGRDATDRPLMSDETRRVALRLLDSSLSQIVADTRGVDRDGWPVEERRVVWENNHAARLLDTWSSAVIRVATGEVPW